MYWVILEMKHANRRHHSLCAFVLRTLWKKKKRHKNLSEPHFAAQPMNLCAGLCHWTERSLCTTVCCLYASILIYSLLVFLYQGALNPSEILHEIVVPAVNTSTCIRQTVYNAYVTFSLVFYCCTVHIVTIIPFIPIHVQFYTLWNHQFTLILRKLKNILGTCPYIWVACFRASWFNE
jgi:hypothetical protein